MIWKLTWLERQLLGKKCVPAGMQNNFPVGGLKFIYSHMLVACVALGQPQYIDWVWDSACLNVWFVFTV